MPRFDESQPHYEVFGSPGVKYEQAGRLYSPGKRLVTLINDKVTEIEEPEEKPVAHTGMTLAELRQMAAVYQIEGAEKMKREELEAALEAK